MNRLTWGTNDASTHGGFAGAQVESPCVTAGLLLCSTHSSSHHFTITFDTSPHIREWTTVGKRHPQAYMSDMLFRTCYSDASTDQLLVDVTTTTMPPTLDARFFPHILDSIIHYSKLGSLVLGATSKSMKARIDPIVKDIERCPHHVVVTSDGPEYADGRPVPVRKWGSLQIKTVDFPASPRSSVHRQAMTCLCHLGSLFIWADRARQSVPVCRSCVKVIAPRAVIFFDIREVPANNPVILEPKCIADQCPSIAYTILRGVTEPAPGSRLIPIQPWPTSTAATILVAPPPNTSAAGTGADSVVGETAKTSIVLEAQGRPLLYDILNLAVLKRSYENRISWLPAAWIFVDVEHFNPLWLPAQPSPPNNSANMQRRIADIVRRRALATLGWDHTDWRDYAQTKLFFYDTCPVGWFDDCLNWW